MKAFLMGEDLWHVIKKPEEGKGGNKKKQAAPDEAADAAADAKVYSLLTQSVDDIHLEALANHPTSAGAWAYLEKQYTVKSLHRRLILMDDLRDSKWARPGTMHEHIGHMRTTANQLAAMGCPVDDKVLMEHLLMTVPRFGEYRGALLYLESVKPEELTWDVVAERILLADHKYIRDQRIMVKDASLEGSAHMATLSPAQAEEYKKKGLCFKCGQHGHRARDCEKKKKKDCGCPCTCGKGTRADRAKVKDSSDSEEGPAFAGLALEHYSE